MERPARWSRDAPTVAMEARSLSLQSWKLACIWCKTHAGRIESWSAAWCPVQSRGVSTVQRCEPARLAAAYRAHLGAVYLALQKLLFGTLCEVPRVDFDACQPAEARRLALKRLTSIHCAFFSALTNKEPRSSNTETFFEVRIIIQNLKIETHVMVKRPLSYIE